MWTLPEILDSIGLYLYPISQKFHCDVTKHFPRKDLFRKFLPGDLPGGKEYYFGQDVKPGSNAQKILSYFIKLLKEPGLVRVDPYDHEKILTEEEMEVDRLLEVNCAAVEAFKEGLESIELKPGIINLDSTPRVNN